MSDRSKMPLSGGGTAVMEAEVVGGPTDPETVEAARSRWLSEAWAVHMAEHEAFDCCEWLDPHDSLKANTGR